MAQVRTLCCCRHRQLPNIFPDAFLEGRARAGRVRAHREVFLENAIRNHHAPEDAVLCEAEHLPQSRTLRSPSPARSPAAGGDQGSPGGCPTGGSGWANLDCMLCARRLCPLGQPSAGGTALSPPSMLQTRGEVLPSAHRSPLPALPRGAAGTAQGETAGHGDPLRHTLSPSY